MHKPKLLRDKYAVNLMTFNYSTITHTDSCPKVNIGFFDVQEKANELRSQAFG